MGIDIEEAEIIKKLAILLNDKLREIVANQNIRNQIHYQPNCTRISGISTGISLTTLIAILKFTGYCSDRPLFVGAGESFLKQSDWNGFMHPNYKGQEAYANRIAKKIRAILNNHLEEFRPKEFHRVGDPTGGGSNPSTTTRSGVT